MAKRPTPLRAWLDEQPKPNAIVRLHETTGISLRSLYRYASGEREPSIEHAALITRATGIPAVALVSKHDRETIATLAGAA
jgi:transcriptional regulator with XRE-family HTH domain